MNENSDPTRGTTQINSEILIPLFCFMIKYAEEDSLLN